MPRCYKQDNWGNELVVGQSLTGKSMSTKTEDIVVIRHQATTGEDIANWEELICAVVTVIFGMHNPVRLWELFEVTICKFSINPITNPKFVYSHSITWQYMWSGGIAPPFLTSALDEGEWLASCPLHFTTEERTPGIHWIGGWMGPISSWYPLDRGLDGPHNLYGRCGVEKNVLPLLRIKPQPCSPSLYRLSYHMQGCGRRHHGLVFCTLPALPKRAEEGRRKTSMRCPTSGLFKPGMSRTRRRSTVTHPCSTFGS
jgi:hypothetical protein